MHGKKSLLALSTAFAALFVGCEWTGSSDSDSWSSAYDAMNFSGTYRAVTRQTSTAATTTTDGTTTDEFESFSESGGTFPKSAKSYAGVTDNPNVVPGSLQVQAKSGNNYYIWNDNGSGSLVYGGGSSSGGDTMPVANEPHGTTSASTTYSFKLSNDKISPGSVTVRLGASASSTKTAFTDNGNGTLTTHNFSGGGGVNYTTGDVVLTFNAAPTTISMGGLNIYVDYSVIVSEGSATGGGAVQYSSGSWSVTLPSEMPADAAVTVSYSAYTTNQGSTKTRSAVTSGTDVSALTVSQNGQNLTITLNNGIVMKGKFTNVQQTGKVNQDTNAGYNTYNAQFQVATTDNKFVGSLNYDLQTGYRMLNGTWTWGKSSFDVQAAGPAWLNSADQSTLSPGVITK